MSDQTRRVNIYVNNGDALKAYDKMVAQSDRLTNSVKKNGDELAKMNQKLQAFSGSKTGEEYRKLEAAIRAKTATVARDTQTLQANTTEMDRMQRKIKGELSPSYNDLARSISTARRELNAMSREDGGYAKKKAELESLVNAQNKYNASMGKSSAAFGSMGSSTMAVAAGAFIANAASSAIGVLRGEMEAGIEAAKALEGVKTAFDRLNNPLLLAEMQKATRGTVSDLELMKQAVMANNFQIPLEQMGTLFQFASQRAKDTGQSIDYLVQSIITGIGRKSPLILDNLGISAARLRENLGGIAAEQATTAQVTEAVSKIIREENAKMGASIVNNTDKITAGKAAWENFRNDLVSSLLPSLARLYSSLSEITSIFREMSGLNSSNQILIEQRHLNTLVSTYRDANTSQQVRSQIMSELKDKYPDFIKQIDLAKDSDEKLRVVMAKTNKEYENRFFMATMSEDAQKHQEKMNRLLTTEMEMTLLKQGVQDKVMSRETSSRLMAYSMAGRNIDKIDDEIKKNRELQKAEEDLYKKRVESVSALMKSKGLSGKSDSTVASATVDKPSGISKEDAEKQKKRIQEEADLKDKIIAFSAAQRAALESDDAKELESVRKKYADMVDAVDKVYPQMGATAKAYRDELYRLQTQELSGTMSDQQYAAAIKANEVHHQSLLDAAKQEYADGIISKKEYATKIEAIELALLEAKKRITIEAATESKKAEADVVSATQAAADKISSIKIKAAEDVAARKLAIEAYLDSVEDEGNNQWLKKRAKENKEEEKRRDMIEAASMQLAQSSLAAFSQIFSNNAEVELRIEQRTNDAKKKRFKQMLDSKKISQQQYDKYIEKADEESNKKMAAIKKKQFEAEKIANISAIIMNTSVGVMKTFSELGWPAGILPSALLAAKGGMEVAVVASREAPEFGEGGVIPGPHHSDGGMDLVDRYGRTHGNIEGDELLLSKEFRRKNKGIESALLEASRRGIPLSEILPIFSPRLPSVSVSRVSENIMYERGGALPSVDTITQPTSYNTATSSNPSKVNDGDKIQKLIDITLEWMNRDLSRPGPDITADEMGKQFALWLKKSGRII